MSPMRKFWIATALLAGITLPVAPALAVGECHGTSFENWLASVADEAATRGISQSTVDSALRNVRFDANIVARDRGQGVFAQSFTEFAGRMVAQYRLDTGRQLLQKHASLFERIEQQYGVPGPVIVGFWGLETDFGANTGDFPTLTALASLGYDCRRPELFREQLIAALALIDRGDLRADEMRGAWAGEIGQMQFLPTDYLESAVDHDGDGRRNLIKSMPDVLASSANLLRAHGWRAGEPWLEEVRISDDLPWDQTGLDIRLPRSQWASLGVTRADGSALPGDNLPAAMLLPMGRKGPAFLAYPNFDVYTNWNKSLVYATTAAYYATRLDGAPKMKAGNAEAMGAAEVKQVQQALVSRGYDVGKVDGIIGAQTRAAIRDVQLQLGLPADSYPTRELLQKLR